MRIPHRQLAESTLIAVIEHFILREGTDYGEREYSLAEKVAQVRAALDCGELVLLYSPQDNSLTIAPAGSLPLS
jgi:uncharacterized protein YheU (UPF0270 family)